MNARPAGLGLALVLVASACGGTGAGLSTATGSPAAVATEAPATSAATTPPATAAPTATASPVSTRTPDPDQVAAGDALEAFSALARDEALTYRMEQSGSATASSGSADFTYAIDVSGSDFSAVMTVGGETTELRGIGGTLYVKGTDGSWTTSPLSPDIAADIVNPWQYLGDLGGLAFLSRAPKQMEAFQFANSTPVEYQTSSMRASGIKGAISQLNFIVMPDGIPVELWFAAETPDGQGGTVKLTAVVAFSKVGDAITIEKPAS